MNVFDLWSTIDFWAIVIILIVDFPACRFEESTAQCISPYKNRQHRVTETRSFSAMYCQFSVAMRGIFEKRSIIAVRAKSRYLFFPEIACKFARTETD